MDPKIEEMAQFLLDCAMLEFKIDCIMGRVPENINNDDMIDHLIKKLINRRLKQSTITGGTTCVINESQ